MLLYVLLALSVIVSLFGMVNTMVLSVFERTRELGMLRAIGMTRRQARRMIRHESVITALIGAALGVPLGVFLAAIATQGLSDQGIGFHLRVGSLVALTAVAVIAGIPAAVLPARRPPRPPPSRPVEPRAPPSPSRCSPSNRPAQGGARAGSPVGLPGRAWAGAS